MKKIIKRKKRPSAEKNGLTLKRRLLFKRIKNCKSNKHNNAPHNTSQYLIENNSSPFYEDEEDTDIEFMPIISEDYEELFEEDYSNYKSKISQGSTHGESFGIDSHKGKQKYIFSIQ